MNTIRMEESITELFTYKFNRLQSQKYVEAYSLPEPEEFKPAYRKTRFTRMFVPCQIS
jgi:hypothetical protein